VKENLMRRTPLILFCLTLTGSTFCATLSARAGDPAATLRDTEYAFARSVANRDLERFRGFLDSQAVFASGKPLRGPAAIVQAWSPYFEPDGPPLIWCPSRVVIIDDGTMGMTTGPYETEVRDREGNRVRARGAFFSVWRRQQDGSWKILLDSGTPPAPVSADAPEQLDCASK
jgi:ketosteroid isomerase-like protein